MTVTNPFASLRPSAAERMPLRFSLRKKADPPLATPDHPYPLVNPASRLYARFRPIVGQTSRRAIFAGSLTALVYNEQGIRTGNAIRRHGYVLRLSRRIVARDFHLYEQRPVLSASADNQQETESLNQPNLQQQAFLPKLGTARQPLNEAYPGRVAAGSEPAADSSAAKPRLLVIDDNTDAALTLSMLLRLKGYEVHSRYGGREGLAAAEQLRPAIILCDIGMPEMDGYETARLIRQQPWGKVMTLVALTGYGQAEDRRRTKEAGFAHHLTKPVDLAVLIALLEALSCP